MLGDELSMAELVKFIFTLLLNTIYDDWLTYFI